MFSINFKNLDFGGQIRPLPHIVLWHLVIYKTLSWCLSGIYFTFFSFKHFPWFQKLGNEDLLLSLTDNYTFFAPTDQAMDIVISRMESAYWQDPDNILNFIRFIELYKLPNDVVNYLSTVCSHYFVEWLFPIYKALIMLNVCYTWAEDVSA